MARFSAIILLAATLSACAPSGSEPPATNAAADDEAARNVAASAERASFDIDEVDARDLVEGLGGPWRAPQPGDAVEDSFSGGYARTVVAAGGTSRIMALANGKVWNLQLLAGLPRRCGAAMDITDAIAPVLARLAPGQRLTDAQLDELSRGLASETAARVEAGRISVATRGGCVKRLDIRTVAAS